MKKLFSGLLLLASFSFAFAQTNPQDLVEGMQNDEVYSLQQFLITEKVLSLPMGATGYFGASTRDAVNAFKSKKGLSQNGVVDCATRAYIPTITACSVVKTATGGTGVVTSGLTSAQDWYQQNCLPEPVGLEYGSLTPSFYTPSGMGGTELAQINKPFTVSATGLSSTTIGAKITASDSQVDIQPTSCKAGMPSGGMGCTVTISGEPRDVYLKIFNGRPGIKPLCHKVTAYRAPIAYTVSLNVDKEAFGSGEAFKVTLTGNNGFSRDTTRSGIVFTRSNAPASSCEYAGIINSDGSAKPGSICQGDGVIGCAMIPGTTNVEYLCAATGLDMSSAARSHNKNSDVTYTAYFRSAHSLFDTFTFDGKTANIKLWKQGTNNNGGMTSYGNCSAGEGIDPRHPENGCTRCQNIANTYRTHISTCTVTGVDTFVWKDDREADQWDNQAPRCGSGAYANAVVGRPCTPPSFCVSGTRVLSCGNTSTATTNAGYHGKVLDENNNPLNEVTVEAWSVTGNVFAYASPCPKTKTKPSGEYSFTAEQSKSICFSSGAVRFKKAGYVEESIPVGNEFDKLIKTHTMKPLGGGTPVNPGTPANPNALSLSPSSARLGHSIGSSVTFTLANGGTALATTPAATKLDVCYEITRREQDQFTPPGGIHKAASPSSCNWINQWTGNSDWDKVNGGKDLQWKLNYTATEFDICKGVQIVLAFRHRDTGQVTHSVLDVDGRPANDPCHGGTAGGGGAQNTAGYHWVEIPAFSPIPPSCASTPTVGASCSANTSACTAQNGKQYACANAQNKVYATGIIIVANILTENAASEFLQDNFGGVCVGGWCPVASLATVASQISGYSPDCLAGCDSIVNTVITTVVDTFTGIVDDVIDTVGGWFGFGDKEPDCLAGCDGNNNSNFPDDNDTTSNTYINADNDKPIENNDLEGYPGGGDGGNAGGTTGGVGGGGGGGSQSDSWWEGGWGFDGE